MVVVKGEMAGEGLDEGEREGVEPQRDTSLGGTESGEERSEEEDRC